MNPIVSHWNKSAVTLRRNEQWIPGGVVSLNNRGSARESAHSSSPTRFQARSNQLLPK
jgi:hypothetical protein